MRMKQRVLFQEAKMYKNGRKTDNDEQIHLNMLAELKIATVTLKSIPKSIKRYALIGQNNARAIKI